MTTKSWALEMALYSKWQNDKLYGLCDGVGDADRKHDRGMFFGSIHGTLDHILMVDRVIKTFAWTGEPITRFDPDEKLYDDYQTLKRERLAFDEKLVEDIRLRPVTWFDETISFHSPRLNRERSHSRQFPLMQLFNHGTHHRAQVTAELHRMGIDYGNTDLPFNPLSQY
jgi:uncharacterized damage-inducible protein DinB